MDWIWNDCKPSVNVAGPRLKTGLTGVPAGICIAVMPIKVFAEFLVFAFIWCMSVELLAWKLGKHRETIQQTAYTVFGVIFIILLIFAAAKGWARCDPEDF